MGKLKYTSLNSIKVTLDESRFYVLDELIDGLLEAKWYISYSG